MRRSLLEDFTYMSEAHVHTDDIFQTNDRSCPPRKLQSSTPNISLCPTYQVLDRDERRTPSNILQTRCRCDRCNMRKKRRYQYKCTPVFRYIPVLMQTGCTNGVYDYMVAEEKVSVACVCTESSKSKQSQRTESSTLQRKEYSLSDNTGSVPDIDKMSVNFESIKPPESSQSRNTPNIIDFRSMESKEEIEEGDNEENEEWKEEEEGLAEEEVEDEEDENQHQTQERLSHLEKIPSVIEAFDDTAVEASKEMLPEIQQQDIEKMPIIPQPRGNSIAAPTFPNEPDTSTKPANRVSTQQALTVPGNVKMPIAFGQSHDYYSNERMPE
ncbi:titin-like [Argopecten irradians]|uniref:titin-like n=1 Tax=Argopecten irradians TaxID=31199 RepID=UPI003720C447